MACEMGLNFSLVQLNFISHSRPRTGFDKSSLERLEQLFRKTVGSEKEIRREDFKKIVTSKNVRTGQSSGQSRINVLISCSMFFFFSHSLRIAFSKYSTKIIPVQFRCKSSSMPFINLPANRPRIKLNFCSKSMTSTVSTAAREPSECCVVNSLQSIYCSFLIEKT